MTDRPSTGVRVFNLVALAFLGVLVGYLIMTGWRRLDFGTDPASPPAEATDAAPTSASPGLPPLATERSGSSASVVGGMTPEELRRLQEELARTTGEETGPAAAPPPMVPLAGAPLAPGETPASVLFPPAVREEARRYLCLCGCGHDLASCPCNDQPIGAITMLSYLQKLMDAGGDPAAVQAGMVERYGERVMLSTASPAVP